jgi:hypothetical protein
LVFGVALRLAGSIPLQKQNDNPNAWRRRSAVRVLPLHRRAWDRSLMLHRGMIVPGHRIRSVIQYLRIEPLMEGRDDLRIARRVLNLGAGLKVSIADVELAGDSRQEQNTRQSGHGRFHGWQSRRNDSFGPGSVLDSSLRVGLIAMSVHENASEYLSRWGQNET